MIYLDETKLYMLFVWILTVLIFKRYTFLYTIIELDENFNNKGLSRRNKSQTNDL